MTLVVDTRDDFTLDAYRRAAWQGEAVRIADADGQRGRTYSSVFRSLPRFKR